VNGREKRHARQFEPPPWEQSAFDEFQRLKAEREQEDALQAAIAAAVAPVEVAAAEVVAPETGVSKPAEAEVATDPDVEADESAGDVGAAVVSSAVLETMLIGLKVQEPPITKSYTVIANVVSALLLAGGLGFVIWAAVLFARVGPNAGITPTLASLLLMVWGFLLIAGAGLLYKKYNLS